MEAHLFRANNIDIVYDPNEILFFVVPREHVRAVRDLIDSQGQDADASNPVVRVLLEHFAKDSGTAKQRAGNSIACGPPGQKAADHSTSGQAPARAYANPKEAQLPSSPEDRIGTYRAGLSRFTLMLTDRCTLRCRYCYEGSECNPHAERLGSDLDTLAIERGLEFVFSNYRAIGTIMFFGGEPLLRPDLMLSSCEKARELARRHKVQLGGFGVVTNGTLMTEAALALIKQEGMGVTLSCDGPMKLNDAWRVWPSGSGSYRWIESAARKLGEFGVPFTIQAAITPEHAKQLCGTSEIGGVVRRWTASIPHIVAAQIASDSSHAWTPREKEWLVSMYSREAQRCLLQIESGNLKELRPFTRMTSVLRSLIWRRGSSLRCPAGTEVALAPDGWLYPCFMFANGDPAWRLCRVQDPNPKQYWRRLDAFIAANRKLANAECASCWARALCTGCMGANHAVAGGMDHNEQLNCKTTKSLAEAIMGCLAEIQIEPGRWSRFQKNYALLCNATVSPSECP